MKRMAIICSLCVAVFSGFGQESLQIHTSVDGKMEGSLIKVKVRRDVMTVQLKVMVGDQKAYLQFNFEGVYYTVSGGQKKYFPKKDTEGMLIGGPKYDDQNGGRFRESLESGQQRIIWVKFPAPPTSTGSVDIFFPGFPLFKGLAITP